MNRQKTYFIEESQTHHTFEFLEKRKADPKWGAAYERIRKERLINRVIILIVSFVFILGVLAFIGVRSGSEKESNVSDLAKDKHAKKVDTTTLSENQVAEWVTAVVDERNRNSSIFNYTNYTLEIKLKEDGLVYIDVMNHANGEGQVLDIFRVNELGYLEESGLYLSGQGTDSWLVISKEFLDISRVSDYQYSATNIPKKSSKVDVRSDLDNYYQLSMGVKVLLAMSLAADSHYPVGGEAVHVFEDFHLNSHGESDHYYYYELIDKETMVIYQGSKTAELTSYELYFTTSGETIKPLYYVEKTRVQSAGEAETMRSEKRDLDNHQTDKGALYQHYLENQTLYNRLGERVIHDGAFLKREQVERGASDE